MKAEKEKSGCLTKVLKKECSKKKCGEGRCIINLGLLYVWVGEVMFLSVGVPAENRRCIQNRQFCGDFFTMVFKDVNVRLPQGKM